MISTKNSRYQINNKKKIHLHLINLCTILISQNLSHFPKEISFFNHNYKQIGKNLLFH